MSTPSPNMGLTISTVNVDSGLAWETNLNASLNVIDGHNHTPGYGVQIPPDGLDINSNLTFQNNSAINLQSCIFTNQSSFSTLNALYVIGNELWFNDATSPVQITAAGSVNATTSGISSGSATASFSGGVLIVNSATNTPANIQARSILLGNDVANSNYLTLSPPSAMASNINETLPTIPAVTSIMQMNSSGVMTAALTVDNSTIVISSQTLEVPTGGITATQIADNTITATQIANGTITATQIENETITDVQIANETIIVANMGSANITSDTGSAYSNSTTSFTEICGVVAHTSFGWTASRPLIAAFSAASFNITNTDTASHTATFQIIDTGYSVVLSTVTVTIPASTTIILAPGSFNFIGLIASMGVLSVIQFQAKVSSVLVTVSTAAGVMISLSQV